jgi:hypothetical protein
MNFFETIESIKHKLKENNDESLAEEILYSQLEGGTGGEVLISVCSKLLEIKRKHRKSFSIVEEEARSLILYANSIGLYPM